MTTSVLYVAIAAIITFIVGVCYASYKILNTLDSKESEIATTQLNKTLPQKEKSVPSRASHRKAQGKFAHL